MTCEECEALWVDLDDTRNDNFTDMSTYLEGLGLKAGWKELEEA